VRDLALTERAGKMVERDEYEETLGQLVAIEVLQRQINARLETCIDQYAQVLERHETLLSRADEALAAIRVLAR
jgi:hypothetical protein